MRPAPLTLRGAALAVALFAAQAAPAFAASWQLGAAGTAVDLLAETGTVGGIGADRLVAGTLQDLSAPGQVLLLDAMTDTAPIGDAALERGHAHLLSVDTLAGASTAALQLSMSRSWSLQAASASLVDGLSATQDLSLTGVELRIVGEAGNAGEAVGTLVAVRLRGQAELLPNALSGGEAGVGLEITDASGTVLARHEGHGPSPGLGGVALDFQARVGDVLLLNLWAHRDTGLLPRLQVPAGGSLLIEDTVMLQGELTVSAVPEPSAWLSLLAGLGVMGLLRRRG